MKERRIRVLVVEPGREAHVEHLKNELEVFQSVVEGEIQEIPIDSENVLICNQNYKESGLKPNRYVGNEIICGSFFIAKSDFESEGYASLDDTHLRYYYDRFKEPQKISGDEYNECVNFGDGRVGKGEVFLNNLNLKLNEIGIDYVKLNESCRGDMQYAAEILREMHKVFEDSYGTDCIDDFDELDDEFVCVPMVIQSIDTKRICLGLGVIDRTSSGEHWGTDFMFDKGFVNQQTNEESEKQEIKSMLPYAYWYTPEYHGDIHMRGIVPDEVKGLIEFARNEPEQTQSMEMM